MIKLKCNFCEKEQNYKNRKRRAVELFMAEHSIQVWCKEEKCIRNRKESIPEGFLAMPFEHWPWIAILSKEDYETARTLLQIRIEKTKIRNEKIELKEEQRYQDYLDEVNQSLDEIKQAYGNEINAEEYFEIIYEKANQINSVDVGFNSSDDSSSELSSPEKAILSEYKGKYIVWRDEEILDGNGIGFVNDTPHVFTDLVSAKEYLAKQEWSMELPLDKKIRDFESKFSETIHIKTKIGNFRTTVFNVYVGDVLLVENLKKLDHDDESFVNKQLSELSNLNFTSITKIRSSNNQRYYLYKNDNSSFSRHIPSRMQGKRRSSLDFL